MGVRSCIVNTAPEHTKKTMNFLPLEFLYKIHRSVRDAKTPFDLTVDYLNYWADFTGLDIIKTRKTDGVLITWEEMNDLWLGVMKELSASFYNQSRRLLK